MKHIVVVVPTFNRKPYIGKLLSQLAGQQTNGFDLRVVVVVDGSTDGTVEMISTQYPAVNIVEGTGNYWYTKSINEGIKEALRHPCDYLLLLNDDIEIESDYVAAVVGAASKFDQPVIMGSASVTSDLPTRVTFSGVRDVIWWRGKHFHYHNYLSSIELSELTGVKPTKLLPGRGMCIDRRIIDDIGLLEERLPQYGSDDEICFRAAKKGYGIYVCWDARIFSHYQMTSADTNYLKPSFGKVLKSHFNPYSRNYWRKDVLIYSKYGNKLLFPLTMFVLLAGRMRSYLR